MSFRRTSLPETNAEPKMIDCILIQEHRIKGESKDGRSLCLRQRCHPLWIIWLRNWRMATEPKHCRNSLFYKRDKGTGPLSRIKLLLLPSTTRTALRHRNLRAHRTAFRGASAIGFQTTIRNRVSPCSTNAPHPARQSKSPAKTDPSSMAINDTGSSPPENLATKSLQK